MSRWAVLRGHAGDAAPNPDDSTRCTVILKGVSDQHHNLLDRLTGIVDERGLLTTAEAMAGYLREWRGRFAPEAMAVVRPASTNEVAAVVAACAGAGVAIVPQGGNTGVVGGAVASADQIVVSLDRMDHVRNVDTDNDAITVEAGCILSEVKQAAERVGRFFPLSLASEGSARIGGNLATNAGGVNVLRYGNTRALTLGLEVVLADGRVWHGLSSLRKDNTGYDLAQWFIGSEGTLGIITAATLKLFPPLVQRATGFMALDDPAAGLRIFRQLQQASGDNLIACELISGLAVSLACRHIPGCQNPVDESAPWYLLVDLASPADGNWLEEALEQTLEQGYEAGTIGDAAIAANLEQTAAFWHIRESVPEAQRREGASIKHDIAVPTASIPAFVAEATKAIESEMPGARVCPFGHLGDGNLHFNLCEPADGDREAFVAQWDRAHRLIYDVVARFDGSFAAEHGIGRLKLDELARYRSAVAVDSMRAIKHALDPDKLLNPGAILPPG